ncbi:MAG: iron chelate uptake ABC transporter family permease subunit [Amaricoccus sp.]|uniref:iron chelate uptake ABC transporter family permease subunit n=1 Tax=Amaricoccus sp. TaxID=1872485 RepID=UPI0039E6BC6F
MSRGSDRGGLTRRAALIAGGAALLAPRVRAAEAGRIVIAGGDLAEIAFALGAGGRVLATDDTATWPPEAAALPKVGYMRRLAAEGILALAPDLVLASADAGPPAVFDQLRAAGLRVEVGPPGHDMAAVAAKIGFVGASLGLSDAAARLSATVAADLARVEAALAPLPDTPSVLFLISVGRGAPMAAGRDTAADAMIRLAHARNAVKGFDGYKPLSAEAAVGFAPEVVLLPDHAVGPAGGAEQAVAAAGLGQTPAGRTGRIVVMDGLKLLGFGPRTPEAVAELARALHPGATLELLMRSLRRRPSPRPAVVLAGFALAVLALAVAGIALGPVPLGLGEVLAALSGQGSDSARAIVIEIRAPRVALGAAVGAGLALSGTTLQGVLRNPLADPGLIGVTAGAALGAIASIVFAEALVGAVPAEVRPWLLPGAAFAGALASTALVFAIARRGGTTDAATLILAGVAINAIAGAGVGLMTYLSDDRQLRDLTFWSMGGLGGASWRAAGLAAACALVAGAGLWRLAAGLDLLQLGERAAWHAGLEVERLKRRAGLFSALAVGAGTAVAGPIGFVGLVAPHIARLCVGPSHRLVAPAAALVGAGLLLGADLAVRLVVPPAEPPVGLATSLIGGPFFLWLLLARMRRNA